MIYMRNRRSFAYLVTNIDNEELLLFKVRKRTSV